MSEKTKQNQKQKVSKNNDYQLHLVAGFPRSGSTLLCQILNMNKDFYASPTSPLLDCILNQQSTFSHNGTFKALDRMGKLYDRYAEAMEGFVRSFYDIDKKVVFDKNRGWTANLMRLDEVLGHENTRIIWTYRNPVDIVASIESRHRYAPLFQFNEESQNAQMATLEGRIGALTAQNGLIGAPFSLLVDAIDMGYEDRIHIVDYKDLCTSPQKTMDEIHKFLELDKYQYDKNNFKDLKQVTKENDGIYNYKFPHIIKEGKIEYKEPEINLPEKYKKAISERFKYVIDLVNKNKNKGNKRKSRKLTKA